MKRFFFMFLLFIFGLIFINADEADIKIFEAVEKSIVYVEASFFLDKQDFTNHELIKKVEKEYESSILDSYLPVQTGSGFFITNSGYLLTNEHVIFINDLNMAKIEAYNGAVYNFLSKIPEEILNAEEYRLIKNDIKKALENSRLYYRVMVDNKNYYICDVVNSDEELDVALLKVKDGKNFRPMLLGDSDLLKVGEKCMAIGYPFATFFFELFKDLKSSMTLGSVSALRSDNWGIQHTASINPGNSGGPLLNKNGEAAGINVGVVSNASGLFFSIPINKVKMWFNNNNLGNIIYENRSDSKKIYLYKNINVEYLEISKNISVALPRGFKVFVNGEYKGETPLNLKNLPAGLTTIRVESDEEYSEQKVNVLKNNDNLYKYLPLLEKFTGKLVVKTQPTGVKVFIDDVEAGITPFTSDKVIAGEHKVELVHERYMTFAKEVNILKNRTITLNESLIKAARVFFKDELPNDVNIRITGDDKEYIFKYKDEIILPIGKYEAEITSDKMQIKKISLDLSSGQNITIDDNLDFIKSKLILKNLKKESIVMIDGIDMTRQIEGDSLDLLLGKHDLIIKTQGFRDIKKSIVIEKNKNYTLPASYINDKLNYEHFYTAGNVLLGVGIPLLAVGSLSMSICIPGYYVMEYAVFPEDSYSYDDPGIIRQKNIFFGIMCAGISATSTGFVMAMISIPIYFIARKVEQGSFSILIDYDNRSNLIIGLKLKI